MNVAYIIISLLLLSNSIPQSQYIEPINEDEFWSVTIYQSNSSLPLILKYENLTFFPQNGTLLCNINANWPFVNDKLVIQTYNGMILGLYEIYEDFSYRYEPRTQLIYSNVTLNSPFYSFSFKIHPEYLNNLFNLTVCLNLTREDKSNYLENHSFYIVGTQKWVWVGQNILNSIPFSEIYLNSLIVAGIICATFLVMNCITHKKELRNNASRIGQRDV